MALPRRVMLAAAISYTYVQGSWDPLFIQPSVVGARSSAQILPKELPPPPTFTLHTDLMTAAEAEQQCNSEGSHLVYYDSRQQQQEVETYFISQGLLLPGDTPSYWIGLVSDQASWPAFSWRSRLVPSPGPTTYSHWPPTVREPNNAAGDEFCAVANTTLYHSGAWGWSDASCSLALPFICRQDVPGIYNYTSPRSGSLYYMVSHPANGLAAEVSCNRLGGHLAVYTSTAEQVEVEAAFSRQGGLIGSFHGAYWLGLQASTYPDFYWLDRMVPPPSNTTYMRWSPGQPGPQEDTNFCAAANASSMWDTFRGPAPWGWQSHDCTQQLVYICKATRPINVEFTSNTTQNTYLLNTSLADRYEAEDACIEHGGHVVSYVSAQEQVEVGRRAAEDALLLVKAWA